MDKQRKQTIKDYIRSYEEQELVKRLEKVDFFKAIGFDTNKVPLYKQWYMRLRGRRKFLDKRVKQIEKACDRKLDSGENNRWAYWETKMLEAKLREEKSRQHLENLRQMERESKRRKSVEPTKAKERSVQPSQKLNIPRKPTITPPKRTPNRNQGGPRR